jgi:large subunit ribosomal protein L25
MELSIQCSKREAGKNPRALRREGLLPAVLYGHNGTESVDLMLNAKDAETLVRKAAAKKTPIHLNVPDMPWEGTAVLQEVQTHPWKKAIYHISFFSVPE